MNREEIIKLIEEQLSLISQMRLPNHLHNSWDSNQLDPAVALSGFPVYQLATGAIGGNGVTGAAGSPLGTADNGIFRFHVDPSPKYYFWAYLNLTNTTTGTPTGAWKGVQLT